MTESAPVDFGDDPEVKFSDEEDDDLKPGFAQKGMINQLGKIADSEEASQDADSMKVKKFSKLDSVTTDDGDDVKVNGNEAKALIKMFNMLSAQRAGEEQSPRERFIRAIQTTKGLESMTAFAKAKGLVEETAEEQPAVNFDDIRDDYSIEEVEGSDNVMDHPVVRKLVSLAQQVQKNDYYFSDDVWMDFQDAIEPILDDEKLLSQIPEYPDVDDEDEEIEDKIDQLANFGGAVQGDQPDMFDGAVEEAGAKDCWDGYKKDGTQPGTGKNKGKRVNNCVKEDEEDVAMKETVDTAMSTALAELRKLAGL
jgi:hypothetical protein